MNEQAWFERARLGLCIHWGSYSLRGMEASWPVVWGAINQADYAALAERFNPSRYDPAAWAALAQAAGARYAVLTTKHHDGLALFDTPLSDYSAPRRAASRDRVAPPRLPGRHQRPHPAPCASSPSPGPSLDAGRARQQRRRPRPLGALSGLQARPGARAVHPLWADRPAVV